MTRYEARCYIVHTDRFTADMEEPDSTAVRLVATTREGDRTVAFVKPAAARTFARGILALADEIDGGEAQEAPALKRIPKVGDKVRIVRNHPTDGDRYIGQTGTLAAIDARDNEYPYRVSFPDDSYGWWCAEVEHVEDEPADTRPKVGDRLRVTEDGANSAPVGKGQIITVHATDYDNDNGVDYVRARLGDADEYAYFISLDHIEPVIDEPTENVSPDTTPSPFARHVDEAKALLGGTDHTGADIIRLAVELADRD